MAEAQVNDNNTCVVCFKNVVYYSIGECDHPVCFECSTRMRVLCLQNECPICRQALSKVVFTDTVLPYKELCSRVFSDKQFERQYKIAFCSQKIKTAYEDLLENRCKLCDNIPPFRSFSLLSDHMRKVHERYFCDLCVKHLKIFTSERRCYTRQELAHHRRKGDLDDTSHRGHPLCEFCEERFMDADELYRHLRKEHLYCHLCDADGRNLYYPSHAALAHHFRSDHYLCEEGDCAGNHLTAVFRSEIDLKAHKATIHNKGMNRGAARQARTLELQFNITPHAGVQMQQRTPRERPPSPPSPPPTPAARIDTRSDEHFPRLSAAPAPLLLPTNVPNRGFKGLGGDSLARNEKNFPTLGGASAARPVPNNTPRPNATQAATVLRNSKPSVSIQVHSQPASASNFRLTQTSGNRISIPQKKQPLSDDDFPSLGGMPKDDHPSIGAGTVQPPKVAMVTSQEMQVMKSNPGSSQPKKQSLNAEAFPALSSGSAPSGSAPSAPPQWISVSKPKEKAKPKPTPPPPREPQFNPAADFPKLQKSKTKKTQPIVPTTPKAKPQSQPQPKPTPPPPQPEVKPRKKDKKKQNIDNVKNDSPDVPYVNGITDKFTKQQMRDAYDAALINNNKSFEIDRKIKAVDTASVSVNGNKKNGGTGDFNLAAMDYPPLNPKSDPLPGQRVTNGSVPPGFKPRPACDGMTFTNSKGQTFSAPLHRFIPPPDFQQRNIALVNKFASALGGADAVTQFKSASNSFRRNVITADEFYERCQSALGSQFETLFPELVSLLPDINKQQELVVGRDISNKLEMCATCGQLLSPADKGAHDAVHWPPLSSR